MVWEDGGREAPSYPIVHGRCKVRRDRRFPVVLSKHERQALQQMAQDEALSAAAVMRRLIIHEARRRGLWPAIRAEGVLSLPECSDTDQGREETSSQ